MYVWIVFFLTYCLDRVRLTGQAFDNVCIMYVRSPRGSCGIRGICRIRLGRAMVGWLVFETTERWSVPTSGMVVGWRLGVCIVVDWGEGGSV